jgi:hypothetical protein
MPANYDGGPYQRQARTADAIRASLDREVKGREVGPCEDCQQRARCSAGLACVSLKLFVNTGRFSAAALRQPNRRIWERIYGETRG